MLSFPESLDALERIIEQMKSLRALKANLDAVEEDLEGYQKLLEYSREKDFQSVEEALAYIDTVLIPELRGMADTLKAGTDEPLQRLKLAREQLERLVLRMRMVVDGNVEDFLA
ncbi:MAG: hypothetical protein ACK2TX_07090 [Anaerolineales bacterium]|jgi:hypothetical protein